MMPLDIQRHLDSIPKQERFDPFPQLHQLQRAIEEAKNEALPPERQGAVIRVGEEFTLNGGRFVVTSIVKEGVFLKGLPSAQEPPNPDQGPPAAAS